MHVNANAGVLATAAAVAAADAAHAALMISGAHGTIFASAELTGTGANVDTPHGLGAVPTKCVAFITGGPAVYAAPSIVAGAHDATNCKFTVTADWKYRILAWL